MGAHLSWFAVSGKTLEHVLTELAALSPSFAKTGPDSPVFSEALASGWALLQFVPFDSPAVSDPVLIRLSEGCKVVRCQVEDHTNFSSASCFENGERKWRVEHDREKSPSHLDIAGSLPEQFLDIVESRSARQAQAIARREWPLFDYLCDVPITIAERITSYRHDAPAHTPSSRTGSVSAPRKRRVSKPLGVSLLSALDALFLGLVPLVALLIVDSTHLLKISEPDYYLTALLLIAVVGAAFGAFMGDNIGRLALLGTITTLSILMVLNSIVVLSGQGAERISKNSVVAPTARGLFWVGLNWWYFTRKNVVEYFKQNKSRKGDAKASLKPETPDS
ncbi:MAG TPA: hypothetical protein VEZ90_06635 [Blastocatellia bacterium]|nr:hypothetical protein [Blastocatellia bacterium]